MQCVSKLGSRKGGLMSLRKILRRSFNSDPQRQKLLMWTFTMLL